MLKPVLQSFSLTPLLRATSHCRVPPAPPLRKSKYSPCWGPPITPLAKHSAYRAAPVQIPVQPSNTKCCPISLVSAPAETEGLKYFGRPRTLSVGSRRSYRLWSPLARINMPLGCPPPSWAPKGPPVRG